MDRIGSYSDVFSLGHKALEELFQSPVTVEEKVDGSQISFARVGDDLLMRSKGKQLVIDAPEKLFENGVMALKEVYRSLPEGWVFRGEYLSNPKHNALTYLRVPTNHVIVFDVDRGNQDYLPYPQKAALAKNLGFEVVPLIYSGEITSVEQIRSMFPKESILGGAVPEGIVIKNYTRFAADKKILIGKYVREEFKETNKSEWKKSNPTGADIIETLITEHRTEARWQKAVQHLRDDGRLAQEPKDIAALLGEVEADIEKECVEAIKEKLWRWAYPKIARGAKAGLPEWYKNRLLEQAIPSGQEPLHAK